MAAIGVRIAPWLPRPRAVRVVERNLAYYRHQWWVILSGLLEPLFYLLGIGLGIGSLIGRVDPGTGSSLRYAEFVAPALMAAAAMNGAIFDSTFNLFYKLKYAHHYDAVLATPMSPADVILGEISWALARGALYAAGFIVVMTAMGLTSSAWALLALPASVLIGFAFAAAGCAVTTFLRSWQDFDLIQLVLLPMFLFSATFYPLAIYPQPLRPLLQASPLYHGVHMLRALTTGVPDASLAADAGFLLLMGVAGLALASRRLDRLLLR